MGFSRQDYRIGLSLPSLSVLLIMSKLILWELASAHGENLALHLDLGELLLVQNLPLKNKPHYPTSEEVRPDSC